VDDDAIRVPSGSKGMRSRSEGPPYLSLTFARISFAVLRSA
jgi:hypothetical protein